MDVKKLVLTAAAILTIGAIVLVGGAVINGFSYQLRQETNTSLPAVTLAAVNASAEVGTGEYPYLQEVVNCVNESDGGADPNAAGNKLSAAFYTVDEGNNVRGTITLNDDGSFWAAKVVNCSIKYLADTTAQGYADKFISGLAVFGTFMSVIVLAIVGKVILSLFKKSKGEE